ALCEWRGKVLAATSGGVLEADQHSRTARKWTTADGLPENDALALLATPDGVTVTFRRSLARWDGRAWNCLPPLPGQDAARPPSLTQQDGRLFAVVNGSLLALD